MRGGPGAQTPGNGGMKKHNPVHRWPLNFGTCRVCCSAAPAGAAARAGRAPGPPAWKFSKIRRQADQIRVRTNFLSWLTCVNSKSLSIHELRNLICPSKDLKKLARHEFQSFIRPTSFLYGDNLPMWRFRTFPESPSRRRDVRRSQYAYGATSSFGMEEVYILLLGTSNK